MLSELTNFAQRELIYLWYYLDLQIRQLAPFYIFGTLLGSAISVFAKPQLTHFLQTKGWQRHALLALVLAALLGFLSPICMFGTLPLAAALAKVGMSQATLACFMLASILLNPQLIVYSTALGDSVFYLRLGTAFGMALSAGLLVAWLFKERSFFDFSPFTAPQTSRDNASNILLRYTFNVGRNLKATLPYFLAGMLLSALLSIHLPPDLVRSVLGRDSFFGVLMAAALGVPLYLCGGGTIPLLIMALDGGMSLGAAAAFMLTGPATKLTNLAALKAVLGWRSFACYLIFVLLFAVGCGLLINLVLN